MKTWLIPAATLLLVAVVCSLGLAAEAPATHAGVAASEPANRFSLWAIDDMVRIDPQTGTAFEENPERLPGGISGDYRRRNAVWSAEEQAVSLVAARNEVIAFQLIVEGRGDKFKVQMTPLNGVDGAVIPPAKIQLFREWYVWVDRAQPMKGCQKPLAAGWYPEICIPLLEPGAGAAGGFAIPSKDFHDPEGKRFPDQKNQAIWVDIHVPADAPAGEYSGRITVKDADGPARSIAVRLKVWDFAIPAEMHMIANLINYGETIREPDPNMMYQYYRMAAAHRLYLTDDKTQSAEYDGTNYDWATFDRKFAPFFDGTAFVDGPTAGVPIPSWPYPIEYHINRIDKPHIGAGTVKDWPVPAPKTPTGYGVEFTPQFQEKLADALRKWQAHFAEKGWARTRLTVFQDSLDEPGFHFKGENGKAGREQGKAIFQTAQLVKNLGLEQFRYRLDIGSGFARNLIDFDGNGQAEGPMDVAKYLAPEVGLFYIQGLCIDMPAVRTMQKHGATVCFYNGFEPRVGPNTIHGEMLGFRTWSVAAWRSGLGGWVDWQFRADKDRRTDKVKVFRKVFFETTNDMDRNLYFFRGEQIGLHGRLFASMRLKSARRGAQDYEMLRLLAIKDGNDKRAQELVAKVCDATFDMKVDVGGMEDDAPGDRDKIVRGFGGKEHWSHDPAAWEVFRRAVGEALSH